MNDTFGTMTVNDILNFATSGDLDDQQLADRLARRIAIQVRSLRSVASTEESSNLRDLVEVTDRELSILEFCKHPVGSA